MTICGGTEGINIVDSITRPVRIGLLGMYASRNLGDVAIQLAVMGALKTLRTDIEFVGLSQDPEDTARTFSIPAFASSGVGSMIYPASPMFPSAVIQPPPRGSITETSPMLTIIGKARRKISEWQGAQLLRRIVGLWKIRRQMQSLDMLLVSGSGQFDDFWGGPWGQPFRMFAWSVIARSQGKPVAVFGVGVDELHTRLGAWFCLQLLERAQLCVVRDNGSRDALRAMGFSGSIEVCPDPAFHLANDSRQASLTTESRFAIISPIARSAWPGMEDEAYDNYLNALARTADYIQGHSIQVRFVCSQTSMDPRIVDRIKLRMENAAETLVVAATTVDEYLAAVRGASVLVGSRLHALILAMVAGTPLIAVSGVRKVHQLFVDIGLPDHAFDIRSLDTPALLARVGEVIGDPEPLQRHVFTTTRKFHPQLDRQFDRLAQLIPARG